MSRKITMVCENPYVTIFGQAYGCGQCLPCRFKKRREWTHRILLERDLNKDNSFVTLTYNDEHLPQNGTLVPSDLRNWLKRFRVLAEPLKIRYYAVGEYGEKDERPHYHLALFGWPACVRGRHCRGCHFCGTIQRTWSDKKGPIGFIKNLALEPASARYVARYVIKKMTRPDDHRLEGRHPEFARMSLKPGIGAGALDYVVNTIVQYQLLHPEGDVPVTLRHGSSEMPLGRYLTKRLRRLLGRAEQAPQSVQDELSASLLPLRLAARASQDNPSLKSHIINEGKARVAQILKQHRLFKQRDSL